MRRSGKRLLLALALAAAVAVSALAVFMLVQRAASRGSAALDPLLREADYSISLGYFPRAEDQLSQALDRAGSEYTLLRVLKRADTMARAGGSFLFYRGLARRAAERIPGARSLRAVFAYACLRSGRPMDQRTVRALERALQAPARQEDLAGLAAEASFSGWPVALPPREKLTPRLAALASLPPERGAERVEQAAGELGDPRVLLDAVLLWMQEGRPERALQLSRTLPAERPYAEVRALVAYDAGKPAESLADLEWAGPDRPDLLAVRADLLRQLGRRDAAAAAYRDLIAAHPGFSPLPYRALAGLLEQGGGRQAALDVLAQGARRFPQNPAALLAYAEALARRGDRPQAGTVLQRALAAEPENPQARLLALTLEGDRGRPYTSRLWGLFNASPGSRPIFDALFLSLLHSADLEGARMALEEHRRSAPGPPGAGLLELEGLLAALQGSDAEAAALLQRSLQVRDDWRVRCNLAAVQAHSGSLREASDTLMKAEALLSPGAQTAGRRSLIRARLAEVLLRLGDPAAARRECEYALDLDPANHQARLILRVIAEE